jgi:hypothetical protein
MSVISFQPTVHLYVVVAHCLSILLNYWIPQAFRQGLIPSKMFSFKIANEGGELYLGGVNPARFVGPLEAHPGECSSLCLLMGNTHYIAPNIQMLGLLKLGFSPVLYFPLVTRQAYCEPIKQLFILIQI